MQDSNDDSELVYLRSGEIFEAKGIRLKLLQAGTKWTKAGASALSVTLESTVSGKVEALYLTRSTGVSKKEVGVYTVVLLNGDNGYVELAISQR